MKNLLAIPLMYIFLGLTACQASTLPTRPIQEIKLISQTLKAEVMFRAWNTKSLTPTGAQSTITVVSTPKQLGEIVILRWNEEQSQFTSEVYKPEDNITPPKNWVYIDGKIEKSISKQPSGAFFISELVSGEKGGRRVERFRLDK
jgi:hypothetical protein